MAATKTIVITVPKVNTIYNNSKFSSRPYQTVTRILRENPYQSQSGNTKMTNSSPNLSATSFHQLIKDEPADYKTHPTEFHKPPRKRQRLDHLSLDQKILRRKMKNRVAAQTARDRKKNQVDDMEGRISKLATELRKTKSFAKSIQEKNAQLIIENNELNNTISQCKCNNKLFKPSETNEIKDEFEIVMDGMSIIDPSNDIIINDDCIMVEDDVSESNAKCGAGVRIPVSIECDESSADTVNGGSVFMDSGACSNIYAIQQPTITPIRQTQTRYVLQPSSTSNKITVHSPQSFKRIQPRKINGIVQKIQPIRTTLQPIPQNTTALQVDGGITQSNIQSQVLTVAPTISSSCTTVPAALHQSSDDDFPNFESLINTCEEAASEIREHDYAVPISDFPIDEELIKQITDVLEQVSAPKSESDTTDSSKIMKSSVDLKLNTNISLGNIENYVQVPSTPNVLDNILSMDEDDYYKNAHIKSMLLSSVSEFCAPTSINRSFQQGGRIMASPASSDSDYESIPSPVSVSSESSTDTTHFDCSSFDELFPSLF